MNATHALRAFITPVTSYHRGDAERVPWGYTQQIIIREGVTRIVTRKCELPDGGKRVALRAIRRRNMATMRIARKQGFIHPRSIWA